MVAQKKSVPTTHLKDLTMNAHILFVDDNECFLHYTALKLRRKYQVSTTMNPEEALKIIKTDPVDLIFLDMNIGKNDFAGLETLQQIKAFDPNATVVILSGDDDSKKIVKSIQAGATDYLCKPAGQELLDGTIQKCLKSKMERDRNQALIEHINKPCKLQKKQLVTESKQMQEVLRVVDCVKGHQNTKVLIVGESGVGKEIIARKIHENEGEPSRPFIAINCAAIPESLLESELFGHEKGAFTGATKRKVGKFELAHNGDIFLDEINSLKPDMQAKLLRVLQENEFYRVGGTQPIQVNARVICAANKQLLDCVEEGSFRNDLLYRLRVIEVEVPALRNRPEDIMPLINFFIDKYNQGEPKPQFSEKAIAALHDYHWPGNVRELECMVQSLLILARKEIIDVVDLPKWVFDKQGAESLAQDEFVPAAFTDIQKTLSEYLNECENHYIKTALNHNKGNVLKTARMLKVSRSTLYNKLGESVGE